jgi:hypothetical protein
MTAYSRTGLWIAAAALSALLGGCASRTLPLPPPEVDSPLAAPNTQGTVLVRGTAQEGAAIGVMNDRTLTGVVVTSDKIGCDRSCPFEARVKAEAGDAIRVWQFFETSIPTQLEVPKP